MYHWGGSRSLDLLGCFSSFLQELEILWFLILTIGLFFLIFSSILFWSLHTSHERKCFCVAIILPHTDTLWQRGHVDWLSSFYGTGFICFFIDWEFFSWWALRDYHTLSGCAIMCIWREFDFLFLVKGLLLECRGYLSSHASKWAKSYSTIRRARVYIDHGLAG